MAKYIRRIKMFTPNRDFRKQSAAANSTCVIYHVINDCCRLGSHRVDAKVHVQYSIWSGDYSTFFVPSSLYSRYSEPQKDVVNSGIELLYRPASLCSLAGRYDNPALPELTLYPPSGTMNSGPLSKEGIKGVYNYTPPALPASSSNKVTTTFHPGLSVPLCGGRSLQDL